MFSIFIYVNIHCHISYRQKRAKLGTLTFLVNKDLYSSMLMEIEIIVNRIHLQMKMWITRVWCGNNPQKLCGIHIEIP